MTEKKPGLLKRIFSFGFGKKKTEEPPVEEMEVLSAPEAVEAVKADQEAAERQAEAAAAEAAAKKQAEKIREEELAAKAAAEAAEVKAAESAAQKAADAEKQREKEAAAARKKAEAEEVARLKAEKLAEAKSAAERAKADEQLRKEAEAAARKEAEAEEAAEAIRKAEEQSQEEEQQRLRKEAEERATAEVNAKRQAEEKAAKEAEDKAEAEAKVAAEAEKARAEAEAQAKREAEEERQSDEDGQGEDDTDIIDADDEDIDEDNDTTPSPEKLKIEESVVTLTERKAKKPAEPEAEPEPEEERRAGWLTRLTKGLSRSSNQLKENISQVFTNKKLDDDTLQDLEDILIQADLGIETAMKITDALQDQKFGKTVTDEEVREIMATEIEKILDPVALDLDLDLDHQPHVILVVGVNGSGKTTTIGKLASKLYDAGFSTTLVAGDTFRAAAIEQLKIWGERTQSPVLYRPLGADSAGLAFDAWEETKKDRRDVMLMDTAGRLQNRKELMDELEKIVRVLRKQDPTAPHTVLLTLDATTGQNALNQVEIFKEVAGVNGLVMTKLDGTARGGILVSISAKHKLPVYFVGVGEQVEDLEPFEAREFARSIAGLPREED